MPVCSTIAWRQCHGYIGRNAFFVRSFLWGFGERANLLVSWSVSTSEPTAMIPSVNRPMESSEPNMSETFHKYASEVCLVSDA